MSTSNLVTAERLRELLHYEPKTGVFTWRGSRGPMRAGEIAGHVSAKDGRVNIHLDRRLYKAHRLAWLYMTEEWPAKEIDHRDTNATNNAWENLRDVTSTINKQNQRQSRSGTKSPLLGAQWFKSGNKWCSSIRVNKKLVWLGLFETDQQAHEAYLKAKRQMHEGNTL